MQSHIHYLLLLPFRNFSEHVMSTVPTLRGLRLDWMGFCEWGMNLLNEVNFVIKAIDVVSHQNQACALSLSFK